MKIFESELREIIAEELKQVLDEKRKRKKRKKKKGGKKDACYYKVKSRYSVWPSAYASGALSKCRKVGAKNWGNKSKKNESLVKEEFEKHMMYDPKSGKSEMTNKKEDHERLAKKGYTHVDPDALRKVLRDEGGASGMDPFLKAIGKDMEKEIIKTLDLMPDVGQHKDKDYILQDDKEIKVVKEVKKKSGLSSISDQLTAKVLKVFLNEHTVQEGKRERDWIKQKPAEEQEHWLTAEKKGLKISDLSWISKVRGEEPIKDIIGDVLYFRRSDVQKKLKDNGFDTNLSVKTYSSVSRLRRLIKKLSFAEESDVRYDNILKDPSQVEFLGKVGNWEILMPISQRGSIACDITGEDTTWCTTKKTGQNMFYSYVARKEADIILFYVVDYSRNPKLDGEENLDARLSIGFVHGEPELSGKNGGLSVNADNQGLTEKNLKEILGQNYSEIMSIMKDKADLVGDGHPAKVQMKKAAKNIFYLKKLVKDYKRTEKMDFFDQIRQHVMTPQVYKFIYNNLTTEKYLLARATMVEDLADSWWAHPDILAHIYDVVIKDKVDGTGIYDTSAAMALLAAHRRLPPNLFMAIYESGIDDYKDSVISSLANNSKCTPDVLLRIAMEKIDDADDLCFLSADLASNSRLPKEALPHIFKNSHPACRKEIIQNIKDFNPDFSELIDTLNERKKRRKKRKLTKKPSSETNLRDWFKRKGAKGSKGGWVDCNAPDGKGGYKSCGRSSGEKRKKYPACRPTPSACKSRGKGKKWGKKGGRKK